jgi:Fic family protein
MPRYIYDLPDWPIFRWNREAVEKLFATVHVDQGRLLGRLDALGFKMRQEAELQTLTQEVLKSSEIEGEKLDADQVRSSIARRLGMDIGGLKAVDRNVEGVVEMMLDATRHYDLPLTTERLFTWHKSLFPMGRNQLGPVNVGIWRDDTAGPMRVISGPLGHERVHFEGPPATRVAEEMQKFLDWFNAAGDTDWVLKAAVAHLWLVTIHPFEDGNGRIARAMADMCLARSENSAQRFYSMSAQIRHERAQYYDLLEGTQKGTMDITPWMVWFMGCLGRAIEGAQQTIGAVLFKARFWDAIGDVPINPRQRRMLNRLLDGFQGKLTTQKWATIVEVSHDTALRDIEALVESGILVRDPKGGRSTSYSLAKRFDSLGAVGNKQERSLSPASSASDSTGDGATRAQSDAEKDRH